MIKTLVILGSTRDGRKGEEVARWFMDQITGKYPDLNFELIDLKEIELPLYHDSVNPGSSNKKYKDQKVQDWSKKVDESDAYIIITPEYNHGYPAPLKNALDSLYLEWNNKPVGFVSYGGIAGGSRAVEQLRQVAVELEMAPVQQGIHIPYIRNAFDEKGQIKDPVIENSIKKMINQLSIWGKGFKNIRESENL